MKFTAIFILVLLAWPGEAGAEQRRARGGASARAADGRAADVKPVEVKPVVIPRVAIRRARIARPDAPAIREVELIPDVRLLPDPVIVGGGHAVVGTPRARTRYDYHRPHPILYPGFSIGFPVPYYVMPGYTQPSLPVIVDRSPAITSFSSLGGPDGAMTFDVSPSFAELYVDGQYAGLAGTFSSLPLTAAPGAHYLELRAPGFRTLAFDTDVFSSEVTPHRAILTPVR